MKRTGSQVRETLSPVPIERFRADWYGQAPTVIRGDSCERFDQLFSWSDFNEIMASNPTGWTALEDDGVAHNRLNLLDSGDKLSPESVQRPFPGRRASIRRVDPAGVNHAVRQGASIGIDCVEEMHGPIARLAEDFERTFGETTSVNVYASWGAASGLDHHYDAQDAFILQVEGRKHWEIREPTRPSPHYRDPMPPSRRPDTNIAWEGWVEPGDVVYVPRGWWHRVATPAGPSLSLTVRVFRRTGIELIEWLTERLRDVEIFRRDLPRTECSADRAAHLVRLRQAIANEMADDVIDSYYEELDAAARPRRPTYQFPTSAEKAVLPADDRSRLRLTSPRRPVINAGDCGESELSAIGKCWTLTDDQLAVLDDLLDGQVCSIRDLMEIGRARLGDHETRMLLEDLVLGGLLAVAAP